VFNASGVRMEPGMYNPQTVRELLGKSSPAQLLTESNGKPTIMCYGEKDFIVKPKVRKAIMAAYKKAGTDHTLILFKNSGHDLGNDPDCVETLRQTVDDYIERYFE